MTASETFINMITEKGSSAGKEFKDINNNGGSNKVLMFYKQFPPVAFMKKDVPEFNFTADKFHSGIIQNYNNSGKSGRLAGLNLMLRNFNLC